MNTQKLPRGVFVRDNSYWIRYSDDLGRIHREKIGPFLKQALAAYHKRKSEVREGKFFPDKVRERTVTFVGIAQDFLGYSRKNKRSHRHDQARMETLLRLWRDCSITELTAGRIETDLAECGQQQDWAPATYNRHRALVSGVFSLAVRNGKSVHNPVRGTKHRIENNTRVRYLNDEEESQLFNYFREHCPEREAEVVVALHSGMRRSEQYSLADCEDSGLRWGDIDFRVGVITIRRSKHGSRRHLPMNSVLRDTLISLKRQRSTSPFVFSTESPSRWFQEVCTAAGIANFTWHCLRHTFASRLVMAGVDLRTVQELMGHKSIVTTTRYSHLAPGREAEAVERLVSPTSTATSTNTSGLREGRTIAVV